MFNMENCWYYGGLCLENPPDNYYGFVYKITSNHDGSVYYGKKAFVHNQKKTISKKARKLSGSRKRVEKVQKDSGWKDYYGSSKPFLEHLGRWQFHCKREILKFCKDKASLAYWEMAIMVQENVLFRDDCWNGNVSGKFFKGKIHG